jgi:threonine/homoserine/homoserine lactone efflux protein
MEFHLWLSLAAICFMGALSPGPSLALIIKNTLAGGKKQGYASAISHGLGVALYAAFTVMGIGIVITKLPWLFQLIQYAGAAFLLYLGISAIRSHQHSNLAISAKDKIKKIQVNGWRDGFLIAFLNPKLAIFFLALFSQFIAIDDSLQQKIIMVATVGIIDTAWYCLVTYGISRGPILTKLQNNQNIVQKVTGCFLILLAVRVVWI